MRSRRCSRSAALKLDAVIELVVDDKALVGRIGEARRGSQGRRPGGAQGRQPGSVRERLREYYKKTAPLIGYYYAKGMLKGVDGMAGIDEVTEQIETVLTAGRRHSRTRELRRSGRTGVAQSAMTRRRVDRSIGR